MTPSAPGKVGRRSLYGECLAPCWLPWSWGAGLGHAPNPSSSGHARPAGEQTGDQLVCPALFQTQGQPSLPGVRWSLLQHADAQEVALIPGGASPLTQRWGSMTTGGQPPPPPESRCGSRTTLRDLEIAPVSFPDLWSLMHGDITVPPRRPSAHCRCVGSCWNTLLRAGYLLRGRVVWKLQDDQLVMPGSDGEPRKHPPSSGLL